MHLHSSSTPMPAIFVAHGSPMLALDPAKGKPLASWATAFPKPKAIVVISAHFEKTPVSVEVGERPETLYDFYGFPSELYQLKYPAKGALDLGNQVLSTLSPHFPVQKVQRGWDHGVWVPLMHLYPNADVPVLQISLPTRGDFNSLVELGRVLRPLRHEGVLLMASGNLVHNLRRLGPEEPIAKFAREFDDWVRDALVRNDLDSLLDFQRKAPSASLAHPTLEHYLPLLVAAGAGLDEPVSFPQDGFELGSISRRCVQFG